MLESLLQLVFIAKYADPIFFISVVLLDIAFLPTLLGKHKPALHTSILFAIILTVLTVTVYSIGLQWSAIGQGVGALMWSITIFQKRLKI